MKSCMTIFLGTCSYVHLHTYTYVCAYLSMHTDTVRAYISSFECTVYIIII